MRSDPDQPETASWLELAETVDEHVDGHAGRGADRQWRFDAAFLASNWTCRWGVDCVGILDTPAASLGQGCCSVGAQLLDAEEALQIAALAMTLDPARFEYHAGVDASLDDYFDPRRTQTSVVDGACVFLNRPGFAGGAGCALHLGALDADESPTDWKPSICWQLPIKVVERELHGVPVSIVRRWERADWGPGGNDMAWVCTEPKQEGETSAYVGDRPVIESMAEELVALLGPDLFQQLRAAMHEATDNAEDSVR